VTQDIQTRSHRSSRVIEFALWSLLVLTAAAFLMAGFPFFRADLISSQGFPMHADHQVGLSNNGDVARTAAADGSADRGRQNGHR